MEKTPAYYVTPEARVGLKRVRVVFYGMLFLHYPLWTKCFSSSLLYYAAKRQGHRNPVPPSKEGTLGHTHVSGDAGSEGKVRWKWSVYHNMWFLTCPKIIVTPVRRPWTVSMSWTQWQREWTQTPSSWTQVGQSEDNKQWENISPFFSANAQASTPKISFSGWMHSHLVRSSSFWTGTIWNRGQWRSWSWCRTFLNTQSCHQSGMGGMAADKNVSTN